IRNFSFSPATLNIAAGDIVVFTNEDRAPHTATADNGSFDTGNLRRGDAASITFASAGSVSFACRFHPNMKGTISVS
ncbi:MAG: cupredoxin domain-containing protein, partial [Rhodobacteraceae bacterium]|nr:cupredoxin domain-containing protein [Paracoccaceae bacterium]